MEKCKRILTHLVFVFSVLAGAAAVMLLGLRIYYRAAYPTRYAETVEARAAENDISPELVYAVIRTESGFRPEAESTVGARGLMQITPDTFYWIRYRLGEEGGGDPDVLFVPEANIRYGTATLALLLERFESPRGALAAYHAGWGSVTGWLEDERYSLDGKNLDDIPFGDTDAYVEKVLQTAEIYKKLYP